MNINRINYNPYNYGNYGIQPHNTQPAFGSRNDENSTLISLRDADELKYDVEYNIISKLKNDLNITGENINVYFKNNINSSKLTGDAFNHNFDVEYSCKGFNPNKMYLKGRVDNNPIKLKYVIAGNNVKIEGDISRLDDNTITLLNMIARDFTEIVNNQINIATMIMLS